MVIIVTGVPPSGDLGADIFVNRATLSGLGELP